MASNINGNVFGGQSANSACQQTFELWHRAVRERNLLLMRPRMARDCVFHSPTVNRPFHGRDALCIVLETVSEVFGESLSYERQWLSADARHWALEFTARVDSAKVRSGVVKIKGLDLVTLNADGEIIKFEVVVRPYIGVGALKAAMEKLVPPKIAALMKRKEA